MFGVRSHEDPRSEASKTICSEATAGAPRMCPQMLWLRKTIIKLFRRRLCPEGNPLFWSPTWMNENRNLKFFWRFRREVGLISLIQTAIRVKADLGCDVCSHFAFPPCFVDLAWCPRGRGSAAVICAAWGDVLSVVLTWRGEQKCERAAEEQESLLLASALGRD